MPDYSNHSVPPRWTLISGGLLLSLGLALVLAWHMKNSALSPLHAFWLGVKYNAAWAFIALGLSLVALYFRKTAIAQLAALGGMSIGLLTLFQYFSGINLGIDEWLVSDIVQSNIPYPGRMSPLTATLLVLAAIGILLASRVSVHYAVILILGTTITAIGIVSGLNYLSVRAAGFWWWQQLGYGVALPTAVALSLVGVALINLSWRHWNRKTCILCVPLMLFVGMFSLTFLLWQGILTDEARAVTLANRNPSILPTVVLIIGFLLSVLLAVAGYLGQSARLRAKELTVANHKLQSEIAERVLTQKNLSEARQELVDFMETAAVGLCWLDPKGIVLWANPAEYSLLGFTRDEYVGQPSSKFYVNADIALSLLSRMNSGEHLDSIDVTLRAKNGDFKQLVLSSQPFYKDNALIHSRCFSRDVTQQKNAERALRENMDRFRLSLDNSLDAFIVIDAQGLIIEWSAQSEVMFGWSRDEIINTPLSNTIIPQRFRLAHQQGMKRFIDTGQGPLVNRHIELIAIKRNGKEFPVELSIAPMKWGDSYLFSSFVHDITERKQVQRDLEIYMQKLVQSNRELQQFASISSHDLQEPLRKIRAFGERIMSNHKTELSAQAQDYLSRMQNAAARMQNLIDDLLAYSQVTSRARPFLNVDLNEIVREVLNDLEIRVDNTQAKLDISPLPTLLADKVQMQQLFQNLIGNALKFHKPGNAPMITLRSRYLDSNGQPTDNPDLLGSAEITVEDAGIGFDMKYAEQIFATFQRLHPRQEYEGTGIGLAICRKIAIHHNGNIVAQSELGRGTKFIIKLPLDPIKGKVNAI